MRIGDAHRQSAMKIACNRVDSQPEQATSECLSPARSPRTGAGDVWPRLCGPSAARMSVDMTTPLRGVGAPGSGSGCQSVDELVERRLQFRVVEPAVVAEGVVRLADR